MTTRDTPQAPAPTGTGATPLTADDRIDYVRQFLDAYDRTGNQEPGWKTLGLRGYRRLREILFDADPRFGSDIDCTPPARRTDDAGDTAPAPSPTAPAQGAGEVAAPRDDAAEIARLHCEIAKLKRRLRASAPPPAPAAPAPTQEGEPTT